MHNISLGKIISGYIEFVFIGIILAYLLSLILKFLSKLDKTEIRYIKYFFICIFAFMATLDAIDTLSNLSIKLYVYYIGTFVVILSAAIWSSRKNPFVNFCYLFYLKAYGVREFSEKVTRYISIIFCLIYALYFAVIIELRP